MIKRLPLIILCMQSSLLSAACDAMPPDISKISSPIVMRIQELIEKQKKESFGPPIVAIAGCSAVGKSEFARALQQELDKKGMRAVILTQDDFMNPLKTIEDHLIHPHLDYKKIYDVLMCIKSGKTTVCKPRFDWKKRAIVYEDFAIMHADVVLFDGIYTLCSEESYNFLVYSDLRVFIDALEESIIEWSWQREQIPYEGYTPRSREKFDQDMAWDLHDYHEHILPGKKYADFIIQKDENHGYALHENVLH